MASSRRARPQRSVAPRPTHLASHSLPFLLIIAAGVGTYWNSLGGPFVWDDQTAIVTNASIRQLWPLSTPLRPPRETPVAGRPIVNLTLAINYAVSGLSETSYHVGNVALHIACTLLVFGIVRRTLLAPRQRDRFGEAAASPTALVASLLWMVHPIQSEVVDYVTQRTESVMALFFLLTLYCAMRARDDVRGRPEAIGAARLKPGTIYERPDRGGDEAPGAISTTTWQVLSVASCALGMASKESMVTAPLIVLLYDRVFEFDSWRRAVAERQYLYGGLASTWLVVAGLLWQQPRSTAGLSTSIGSWTYLLNQVSMIARYLWLTIWPKDLVLDYGLPRAVSMWDVLPAAAVIALLVAAAGLALVRWPRLGFLAAAFFVTLAPTSSVIPIASEVGAERRMYLPFAAIAVLAALGGHAWLRRFGRDAATRARARALAWSAALIVLALLSGRTLARNADYANPLTLWQTVVDRRPHGRARMSLATELITVGRHAEAVAQLREAVHDYPDARFALGTELVVDGKTDEAVAALRAFIDDKPSNLNRIPARTLLGQALASQGKLDEAANEFQSILKTLPANDGVRANLADVLLAQRRYAEAATEYRAVVATQPNQAVLERKLAVSLMGAGALREAIEHFQRALQLDPNAADLNRALAEAYLRQEDAGRAESYAREALRLQPNNPAGHNLLGIALASKGDFSEAIRSFRQAIQLNPGDQQARANLERALRAAGSQRR